MTDRREGHSALRPDGKGGLEVFDPHPSRQAMTPDDLPTPQTDALDRRCEDPSDEIDEAEYRALARQLEGNLALAVSVLVDLDKRGLLLGSERAVLAKIGSKP